ncbi:ADP-ribosylglycohydrolase family protein [Actinokineospora sp.]|uniref:ADP-ribosylglycohydrolase family protein n=1 Tax=Actinokineospora sp. TaxID=1872133 RepID=UPI003D6A74C7
MEAAEAVAKAEEWLRAVHGPSGLRVDRDKVRRVPEGWSVPYNSIAYLDGGDAGKEIFPPPRLIVRVPECDLREASPRPGGLSIPARVPGQEYWSEIVDNEFAESGLGHLGVPNSAVAGWTKILADGTTTDEQRANPNFRFGPNRLGMRKCVTPLEYLVALRAAGWLSEERFITALAGSEVLVKYANDGTIARNSDGSVSAYAASRLVPEGVRSWRRVDVATLMSLIEPAPDLTVYGNERPQEVSAADLTAAIARFPRHQPTVDEHCVPPEASPEIERYVQETASRLGLSSPVLIPTHGADEARRARFDLTVEECRKTVLGRSWRQLAFETGERRLPEDLASNGLMPAYDAEGNVTSVLDTFGKYCDPMIVPRRYAWHRVVGAYVGFALGEALGAAADKLNSDEIRAKYGPRGIVDLVPAFDRPGQIGPLTQRLLFLTDGVVRSPHREDSTKQAQFAPAAAGSLLRWLHVTMGDAVPVDIDGWLVKVPELRADRHPDPDDLAAVRRLAAGEPGTGSGPAALLAALPAALSEAWPRNGIDGGAVAAARLLAGLTHGPGVDIEAAAFLTQVFEKMLSNGGAVWAVRDQVLDKSPWPQEIRAMAGKCAPDLAVRGLPRLCSPWELGAGRDTLTVLGQAFGAITSFENQPEHALWRAVNHPGRSALTGALTGALLGMRDGVASLPEKWVEQLELRYLVQNVADDAFRHFETASPVDTNIDRWSKRYPRG